MAVSLGGWAESGGVTRMSPEGGCFHRKKSMQAPGPCSSFQMRSVGDDPWTILLTDEGPRATVETGAYGGMALYPWVSVQRQTC